MKLRRKLQGLSATEQLGFVRHIQLAGGKGSAQLASLLEILLNLGSPIGDEEIWSLWQGSKLYDPKTIPKAIDGLQLQLDRFLEPISNSQLYLRLHTMSSAEIHDFDHTIDPAASTGHAAIKALLKTHLIAIQSPPTPPLNKFQLWNTAFPHESYHPAELKNRLTSLINLLDGFQATMEETKLFSYLSKLEATERTEFSKYVRVFGDKRRVELINLLKVILSNFDQNLKLTRKDFVAIWKPRKPHYINRLNSRLNALTNLLRSYLATKEMMRHKTEQAAYLMRALDKRDWGGAIFTFEHKAAMKALSQAPWDHRTYASALEIEEARLSEAVTAARSPRGGVSFQPAMSLAAQNYLVQILRFAAAAQMRDSVLGTRHNFEALELILDSIREQEHSLPSLIAIHLMVYDLLTENDSDRNFKKLLSLLLRNAICMNNDMVRAILKSCTNHCIKEIRRGNKLFQNILVRIYDKAIEMELFVKANRISAGNFKNLVTIYSKAGYPERAREVLQTHSAFLANGSDPATTYNLNAIILFHEGKFSEARRLFREVYGDSEDIYFQTDARIFSWQCSFELREFTPEGPGMIPPFIIECNRIRTYINRQTNSNNSFIRRIERHYDYMMALYNIETKSKSAAEKCKKYKKLNSELSTEKEVRHMDWLREKVSEAITRCCPSITSLQ